jgi:hypothetical protein
MMGIYNWNYVLSLFYLFTPLFSASLLLHAFGSHTFFVHFMHSFRPQLSALPLRTLLYSSALSVFNFSPQLLHSFNPPFLQTSSVFLSSVPPLLHSSNPPLLHGFTLPISLSPTLPYTPSHPISSPLQTQFDL